MPFLKYSMFLIGRTFKSKLASSKDKSFDDILANATVISVGTSVIVAGMVVVFTDVVVVVVFAIFAIVIPSSFSRIYLRTGRMYFVFMISGCPIYKIKTR